MSKQLIYLGRFYTLAIALVWLVNGLILLGVIHLVFPKYGHQRPLYLLLR